MVDYQRCYVLSLMLLQAPLRNYKNIDIHKFQICVLVKVLDLQIAGTANAEKKKARMSLQM
jgi:hypothetical protein